jgi:hypothetical protein
MSNERGYRRSGCFIGAVAVKSCIEKNFLARLARAHIQ